MRSLGPNRAPLAILTGLLIVLNATGCGEAHQPPPGPDPDRTPPAPTTRDAPVPEHTTQYWVIDREPFQKTIVDYFEANYDVPKDKADNGPEYLSFLADIKQIAADFAIELGLDDDGALHAQVAGPGAERHTGRGTWERSDSELILRFAEIDGQPRDVPLEIRAPLDADAFTLSWPREKKGWPDFPMIPLR